MQASGQLHHIGRGKVDAILKVMAADLVKALAPARPHPLKKKPRPVIVSLEFDMDAATLAVIEAKHAKFATLIPASGAWPVSVQVNGILLQRLMTKWPAEAVVEMGATSSALTLRVRNSVITLERTDGGGTKSIRRSPPKPDKRHRGKVEIPPEPVRKRAELADTWHFSARVPMPQHRDQKDKE